MRAQPATLIRTKSKKNLETAIQAAGFTPGTKWTRYIKAVPIPTNGVPKTRASFDRKGNIILQGEFHRVQYIPMDPTALATQGDEYVAKITKGRGKKETYQIAAGPHLIQNEYSALALRRNVKKLMNQYEKGTPGAKKHGSNWREWMHGVNATLAINQDKYDKQLKEAPKTRKQSREKHHKKMVRTGAIIPKKKAAAKKGR